VQIRYYSFPFDVRIIAWIDDSDIASKRVFTLMLFVATLTNQAKKETAPMLAIPTQ